MEHLGAQGGFPIPAAAGQPLAAEIANFAGGRELRQLRQRSLQHGLVARALLRRPECSSHWMIHKGRARRHHFAHDIVRRADHQGWDAARFDDVGDETDGLMAEGSVGDEQGEVDVRLRQFLRQRRAQGFFR